MTTHTMKTFFHKRILYLLIFPSMFLLLLSVTQETFANTVHLSDQARVLNTSQVQNAASQLNYPVNIYTTNNFNGTNQQFDSETSSKITQNNLIVIAIDTVHRHLAIVGGSNVPLRQDQYQSAISAFTSDFSGGAGYTSSTIAALQSLQTSLASSGNGNAPSNAGSTGFNVLPLCIIGLLVLAGLAVLGFVVSRRRRIPRGPVGPVGPMYNQYNQPPYGPYNQGPYYGPNYPGGYNQGGGIGPWGAGGIGAAAGGFLGYELGKEAGEREAREDGWNGGNSGFDNNNGGDFGNGASGDFGNNGGNDFGSGASGDFGSGAGSDFGSGGDFGGGGGDFGGGGGDTGGSGNF